MNLEKYKSRGFIFQISSVCFKFVIVIQKGATKYLLTADRYVEDIVCF